MMKTIWTGCWFLFLASTGGLWADDAGAVRPNILFIVSEDNGPELACYGDPYARTPVLDQLAADGVRFERAFVPYAVCSPSRACFYTGLHVVQNGHLGLATHRFAMYEVYPTFYRLLKEAGYRTGLIGKLHINPGEAVDDFVDFRAITGSNFHAGGRDMANYAAKAGMFLRAPCDDPNAPFLLTVNYPDAHLPMHRQAHGLPVDPLDGDEVETLPWVGVSSDRLRTETANYYNCLERLDNGIGMLLAELETAGLAEHTLVLYIGDHGAQFSRGKTSVYEAGLRVPFLVRWPGYARPAQVRRELVSTLDIMPTLLQAAGVAPPSRLTGRPLQPLLEGRKVPWRRYVFGLSTGSAPAIGCLQMSVRDDRYKLISNPLQDPAVPESLRQLPNHCADAYLGRQGHFAAGCSPEELATAPAAVQTAYARYRQPPRWELYDLQADPGEWTNRAQVVEYHEVQQRLVQALAAWQHSGEVQDPFVTVSNQLQFVQEQESAIGTNYRGQKGFRWRYLDAFSTPPGPLP